MSSPSEPLFHLSVTKEEMLGILAAREQQRVRRSALERPNNNGK